MSTEKFFLIYFCEHAAYILFLNLVYLIFLKTYLSEISLQIVILERTSWIVHTMVHLLTNQRKKYWHVALNISKTAQTVTGSHPAPLNTSKSAMGNSTGFPWEPKSNWYLSGWWLLSSSFGLFWHRLLCKFLPDVK